MSETGDEDIDRAAAHLSNAVYEAAAPLERLEAAGLVRGNGHHLRQRVAEFAAALLRERWAGPPAAEDLNGEVWEGVEVREGVREFLQVHPDLRPFVREVVAELRAVFERRAFEGEVALEVTGGGDLFVLAKTALEAPAQAVLDELDRTFWLENSGRGRHLVQVSVEFA